MVRAHKLAPVVLIVLLCLSAISSPATEQRLPNVSANDNRTPAGRLDSGVLTLRLEVREGKWHPHDDRDEENRAEMPGVVDVYSFAEEGQALEMPGPLIRVPQGTKLHLSVHNVTPVTLFLHGLHQHPGKETDVIQLAAGETKELNFAAGAPGTYMYWASTLAKGAGDADGTMAGALVVDAPGSLTDDRLFMIQLWVRHRFHSDFQGVLAINGKSWPYTERLQARLGHPEHWRVLNASIISHPMHLHGFYFHVDAVGDGESEQHYAETERRLVVTETVEPGHTFDMTWAPERTGNWIFHCHIMNHMSEHVTPVIFGPEGPPAKMEHSHNGYRSDDMGMAKLVLGITVMDEGAKLLPAEATIPPVAVPRRLFVRERPASDRVPAGPGFYLEGVSRKVEAIGPPLIINRDERTAITVTNELNEPTAIHWHGLEIESYYDGVAGWNGTTQRTTPAIAPGESFVAYMTAPRAGTFIYHTHWHNPAQLTGGMYGALLVMPPGQTYDSAKDKVFVLGRGGPNEMHDPLLLNGSPQPGMMVLLSGQKYRLRFINITPNDESVVISLSSEGQAVKWRAIAKDGADLPEQQAIVEDAMQPLGVGETCDFQFAPKMPGQYELRFTSSLGSEVTQVILIVPPEAPISVYAAN